MSPARTRAAQLIRRILCLPSLEKWWRTPPRLSTHGALLHALTVEKTWEHSTGDMYSSLKRKICECLGAEVKHLSDADTLSTVATALCQIVLASPTEQLQLCFDAFCYRVVKPHQESWAPRLEDSALCARLDMFLHPNDLPRARISIWSLIWAGPGRHKLEFAIHVAVLIALHKRRGLPVSDTQEYIDEFFRLLEESIAEIPGVLCLGGLDIRIHFIRHCIELRSAWWNHFLAYAEGNADDRQKRWIEVLREEVERLGPCTKCYEEYPYTELTPSIA
ncbi:hypothetical protein EXIGLDRAFT_215546 [Exidia glandulosa HHB12029]|uniref:Uncharacterized protein n=1 Tax=Exidia glandulosa HHB12029 TaxID=1314781 RepID=A0A165EGS6_EXIGL|nr:hypothetical protein EXIGLDRAFT_215546 [Exidia glandulosa HHB12029]